MNASAAMPSTERWRLRASDFEVLHDAGALQEVRRAELIDGDIYGMSPQTTHHAFAKTELAVAIRTCLKELGSDLKTIIEVSVVVADDSVPEPDIVVSNYKGSRFMPADTVVLAVEVSSTTLAIDLGRKAALYAAAAIPEYWVFDLDAQRAWLHAHPGLEGYRTISEVPFGSQLASQAVDGLRIDTGFLLD